jgi:LPXTG-motif cell wall-anchored protein
MIRLQISTALIAAALGIAVTVPTARADQYDKKIIATFSEPIEVPGGITLQPGTYVFKLQDSQNDRHIVLIQNQRENHLYAQVFAVNDFHLRPRGKVQIEFSESAAGQPRELKAIFWPGDRYGQAFEYKGRKTEIAQTRTTQQEAPPVAAAEPAPSPEPTPAPQEPVETAQNTPPPAPEPEPAPAVATPEPAPAPAPPPAVVAENTAPAVLPQTASNIPLLALIGFLSVGLAFVLRAFTKRIV